MRTYSNPKDVKRYKYKIVGSIVLYNTKKKDLKKVLESFFSSGIEDVVLCLIDNSPEPLGYIKELLSEYEDLDYIFAGENLGYGKGHNRVFEKYDGKCECFVVLNPDISFEPNVLGYLYAKIKGDKKLGLCSAKILLPDGSQQFAHRKLPAPFDVGGRLFVKKIPFIGGVVKKMFRQKMDGYELKNLDHDKDFYCPSISGCFMFFRAEVFKKIKGFDERFFMYFEDVDVSRRALEVSEVVIFNEVHVEHEWERGSYKNKVLLKHHINSAISYFNKWGWFFDGGRSELNEKIKN
jgi:GT2 family glycosyltransferase